MAKKNKTSRPRLVSADGQGEGAGGSAPRGQYVVSYVQVGRLSKVEDGTLESVAVVLSQMAPADARDSDLTSPSGLLLQLTP